MSSSVLRAYWLPLVLFAASVTYQLVVLPRSYPPSHYDVLGIKRFSSVEEVREAYEKLSSKWNSGTEIPSTSDFIEIQYAFELLTNPLWKRDYDMFSIDENIHILEKVKEQQAVTRFSEIDLPLLDTISFGDHALSDVTSQNFQSKIEKDKAFLIQVYSLGSNRCAQFSSSWKRIAALLDEVAVTGKVELGEVQLANYLAEKTFTGLPTFGNGLPSLVAFPPGCNNRNCAVRYQGELSVDGVTNWFATSILNLPRISYYSKDSLAQRFLGKSGRHKVKVIFFSETGERATPFVRQVAKNYWTYADFAFALWREEESSIWWNMFGVESAPSIVFLKESGVRPVVFHGPVNNSWFASVMEQNKHHELKQLRSATSMELGCDAGGFSRAGNETTIWYCVIVAGRLSQELNKMRETVRRVQDALSPDDKLHVVDREQSAAALAVKDKRLTFTWLDGEAQQKYCFFHIQMANSYETCGPRKDITDTPQLVIVRYKRNSTEDSIRTEKRTKNILETFQNDVDPASQLVARYNGSEEIHEIIKWISQIIEDGDSRDLPFFRAKAPALVPEDADPFWALGARSILSQGSGGLKQKIGSVINTIKNYFGDPRVGPILLLGALMSFGQIWLRRSQSATKSSQANNPTKPGTDEDRPARKRSQRARSNQDIPPSITDIDPKDAYQLTLSDSD